MKMETCELSVDSGGKLMVIVWKIKYFAQSYA